MILRTSFLILILLIVVVSQNNLKILNSKKVPIITCKIDLINFILTVCRLCARCKNIFAVENINSNKTYQCTNQARFTINSDQNELENQSKNISENETYVNSQIWCVDCNENVVVLGCADGSLQFWDLYTGILKV